jgi:sugar/nucleoside kinase (ribokinase family)
MGKMTTRIDLRLQMAKAEYTFLGSGFVALDVIDGSEGRHIAAGGSCGNVSAILAWLGWTSSIVSRLGADKAGDFICKDLKHFGVRLNHVSRDRDVGTPIVLQRFVQGSDGKRHHRFSIVCPECGSWLPRFRSVLLPHAATVTAGSAPTAFYFDRVSPAIIKMANWARSMGSLVVFEPATASDDLIFQRGVEACHILKYSDERMGPSSELAEAKHPALIIQTCGERGLRVRWKGRWSELPAFQPLRLVDAAGSGDWCTAGIIHALSQSAGLMDARIETRKAEIERALRLGQALAAVNCGYEGARGLMYAISQSQLTKLLMKLVGGGGTLPDGVHQETSLVDNLCMLCAETSPPSASNRRRGGQKT